MRKKNALVRVVVWTAVALLMMILLAAGLGVVSFGEETRTGVSWSYTYDNADAYTAGGAEITETMRQIDVRWVSGDVNIAYTDGDAITFHETANRELSEDERLHYAIDGDKLTIQYRKSSRVFNSKGPEKSLTLEIPRGMGVRVMDVESVSADVFIEGAGVSLSEIDIENVSGSTNILDLRADSLSMECVSGNAYVHGAFGEIDLESVSAEVTLALPEQPREIDAEGVSGDLQILFGDMFGVTATLDAVGGRMRSNYAEGNGKVLTYGDGKTTIEVDMVGGDVHIDVAEDIAPIAEGPARSTISHAPAATPTGGEPVPASNRHF